MNRRTVPPRPALLITGGSGFLGRALVSELLRNDPVINASEIRIFDIRPPTFPVNDPRIRYLEGDIRNPESLAEACMGMDAVLHLAAMVDWGTHKPSTVYEVNTEGTARVIKAASDAGVAAFVYTSSLDAVISRKALRDVDESLSYPRKPPNAYCGSKARSEQLVAEADGINGMRTVSLRPSSVWGEADPYHISALVELAVRGPYVRIGDGSAVQQLVYVGNLAHAHLLACRELLEAVGSGREPRCAGQNYFITDAPAENFFHFFDRIVEGSGHTIRPAELWIPRRLMRSIGMFAEAAALLVRPFYHWNPKVSRFAVDYTCNDFTFGSDAAQRDFGFTPIHRQDDALERTMEWFREYRTAAVPQIAAEVT